MATYNILQPNGCVCQMQPNGFMTLEKDGIEGMDILLVRVYYFRLNLYLVVQLEMNHEQRF